MAGNISEYSLIRLSCLGSHPEDRETGKYFKLHTFASSRNPSNCCVPYSSQEL